MSMVIRPAAPLFDGGYRLPPIRTRATQTVRNPPFPLYEWGGLHGLGQSGPGILSATTPIIVKAATGILSATTSIGTLAGPIGAGIGILVGIIAGLWSAHNARVAGAKHENEAINSAVATWDQGMKAIFAAANSSDPSQNVTASQAITQVQQLWAQFWQQMSQFMHAPGTADTSNMGTNCGSTQLNPQGPCAGTPEGHMCDRSCTATCCVGCQDLYPSMLQAIQVLQNPAGGTVQVCQVSGSGYGANERAGYSLTFTPPTVAATAAGVGSGGLDLSSLFGGTGPSGGASSLLPILAIGALAFFALR